MIPYAEQLACVERELTMRRRVYPRRVQSERMTQARAIEEIRLMEAVAATLRDLSKLERLL